MGLSGDTDGAPVFSPQAGKVQVLELIALLAVEAVAVVITVELVAVGLVYRPALPTPKRPRWPFSRTS